MSDVKYLFAYTVPLMAWVSLTSSGWMTYVTPIYTFAFIPLLEIVLKDYDTTYTEAQKQKRLNNIFFDVLLYFNIPFIFLLLGYGFYILNTTSLVTSEYIGIVLSMGILLATNGINVAHELGHRASRVDRSLSKLILLPCLYMHFYLEHNFGHHKNVATPLDPATSRYNQTLYHFWVTSVIYQYLNAWQIQWTLLHQKNKGFLSFQNDMLWYHLFQTLYLLGVFFVFGLKGVFFAVAVGVLSFLFLETINYIEHYGLERVKTASGRYERVQTHHSWNSNHLIGRIVLYELTRHSDHHFKASKKYQILENKTESPQLPFGYPACILLAFFPPLWFRLMNPRIPKGQLSVGEA